MLGQSVLQNTHHLALAAATQEMQIRPGFRETWITPCFPGVKPGDSQLGTMFWMAKNTKIWPFPGVQNGEDPDAEAGVRPAVQNLAPSPQHVPLLQQNTKKKFPWISAAQAERFSLSVCTMVAHQQSPWVGQGSIPFAVGDGGRKETRRPPLAVLSCGRGGSAGMDSSPDFFVRPWGGGGVPPSPAQHGAGALPLKSSCLGAFPKKIRCFAPKPIVGPPGGGLLVKKACSSLCTQRHVFGPHQREL